MKRLFERIALLAVLAVPGWSQFQLYLVNGTLEQPVPKVYDFGAVEPGASLAVPFRIRNVSSGPAILDFLQVNGSGFTISNKPPMPATLASQKSVDLTVLFQSAGTGQYSASLDSVGIGVLLNANVPVELTCQLETAAGPRPLAAGPVDFGQVERGATAVRRVILLNQTSASLMAPGLLVTGPGFALANPSPGGTLMTPGNSATFDVQFNPSVNGAATGSLNIGGRIYGLVGTGIEPALPQPKIAVTLAQSTSAQQGSVSVNLGEASRGSGTGTVTLTFTGATSDPGVAFASGGLTASFTVAPGDTQGRFGTLLAAQFQTGTTAGTLTITVQLNSAHDEQSLQIKPAVVGITAAKGVRSPGIIEVDLTGFDNTRSAGGLTFTFFDSTGAVIGSAIQADGAASFQSYFQISAGGTFALKAVFPVAGDVSRIQAFEAVVANSVGAATTARTSF